MNNTIIRKGQIEDSKDFSKLILLSAPSYYSSLYGSYSKKVLEYLFIRPRNLFSFEHSHFIELNGKKAGVALGYDGKQKNTENLHTVICLAKCLKIGFIPRIFFFLKMRNVSKIAEDEYYLNTISVYPEFRGLGLGKKLLLALEQKAKKKGDKKIILNVDSNNKRAIKFYEQLRYILEKESFSFKVNERKFKSLRMSKVL